MAIGTGEVMSEISMHEAAALERGYRWKSYDTCPRRLVGKKHMSASVGCWCTSRLNEHGGTYERDGVKVILWEPYDADGMEMLSVLAAAREDGLKITVTGNGIWYPGATFLILLSA